MARRRDAAGVAGGHVVVRRGPGPAGRPGAGGVHRLGPGRRARLGRHEGLGQDHRPGLRRADPHRGVVAWSRRGLLRRVADELGDLARTCAQLRAVEADMVMVLRELGLSRLGDIPGLTATGAAAILAETGDPRRYDSSSSLVKHAGLSPSENASGALEGQARMSRRGRPGLRLAWRAVWPMLQHPMTGRVSPHCRRGPTPLQTPPTAFNRAGEKFRATVGELPTRPPHRSHLRGDALMPRTCVTRSRLLVSLPG